MFNHIPVQTKQKNIFTGFSFCEHLSWSAYVLSSYSFIHTEVETISTAIEMALCL